MPTSPFRERAWNWFSQRAHGSHALFWLITIAILEPIFLPIFPEALMVPMILAGKEHWKRYATITAIATTLGGGVAYFVGAFLFQVFGDPIIHFYGGAKWFHTIHHLFGINIFLVMFLISFTFIPNKIVIILAGFFRTPFIPFLLGFFLGRLVFFLIVAYLTKRFGERVIQTILRYFEWVAVAIFVLTVFIILHFWFGI